MKNPSLFIRTAYLALAAVLTGAPLSGAPAARPAALPAALSLEDALTREVQAARASARELGVHIVDLSSHAPAFGYAADEPRILASNTKLLTTAAALGILGGQFEFETRVMGRGTITGDRLVGDVAIVGDGDPNISGRFHDGDSYGVFRSWARQLLGEGIRHVSGDLLMVDGIFQPPSVHPDWPRDQLSAWYEAPVEGLSFNDNCVLVRVTPGSRAGLPAHVETVPRLDYFEIRSTATTTGSRARSHLAIGRLADSETIVVSGAIYTGSGPSEEWVAVQNPAAYFAAGVRAAFAEEGVEIDGGTFFVAAALGSEWQLLASHRSGLARTLEVTNKRSQNFYAESLAKYLGYSQRGEGSWSAGVGVVSEFLDRLGVAPESFHLVDGSGLSRGNVMSPRAMTQLLEKMYFHPLGREFVRSLPYSGEQGLHWQRRLARTPYAGNVFAKTGTIRGVSTLSGYAKAASGRVYAFSILCNQVRSTAAAKAAQDRIVSALIDRG
ncbi:MAG: D-alanyl-D-alanine carboxypeptidase/D-alanyl-D-alanine-endopeptidase [Thermoanaerobaculia bacterium]